MSRVGKKPIPLDENATVTYKDRFVTVKGKKGTLSRTIHPAVDLEIEDGVIKVVTIKDGREQRALQGLTRSLVANMITGVSKGFERALEINGIGFRATAAGATLELALGFSHPISFPLPDGISAEVDRNNTIKLSGIDKELLGHTAAALRRLRPPEPYKGKGIKYAEERIRRKAGKTGTK
ncbi:MAG: 50S ribosomal protein L6 [Desulfobacterales bacterium]|nr:50S ribosomal protein L6 [Desulfobacterales bacterium]